MGKIRVKVFDETEQAEKDKKLHVRREAKRAEKMAVKNAEKASKSEGTVKEEPTPEVAEEVSVSAVDKIKVETVEPKTVPPAASAKSSGEPKKSSKYAAKKGVKKVKSERYTTTAAMVDRKKTYKLADAVELLKKFKKAKFDETIELHINTREKGISGQVSLPHGTGKVRKIKIADDATIAAIEKGVIDFDVLVATPAMMPKLARVAKVLGPRGLMPNPKSGTVTEKPEEAVEKLSAGQVNYKTEAAAPIIHMVIGKASFTDAQITENIMTVVKSISTAKIDNITIKLTMSPAVKLNVTSL